MASDRVEAEEVNVRATTRADEGLVAVAAACRSSERTATAARTMFVKGFVE